MVRKRAERARVGVDQSSMFTGRSFGARTTTPSDRTRGSSWGTPARKNTTTIKPPAEAKFSAGQKVRHAQFGEGIVVSSRIAGDDEEVTVAFPGKGVKRLLANFAKLEAAEG